MIVYVCMIDDKHSDPEAHIFFEKEKAIDFARNIMDDNKDRARKLDLEDISMPEDQLREAGWLFYGCYSVEGDCVWVLPREVF